VIDNPRVSSAAGQAVMAKIMENGKGSGGLSVPARAGSRSGHQRAGPAEGSREAQTKA